LRDERFISAFFSVKNIRVIFFISPVMISFSGEDGFITGEVYPVSPVFAAFSQEKTVSCLL
jgi:hypothetical protein